MSTINQLERDQVCLCRETYSYAGLRAGLFTPSRHQDDCPFFSDDSHAESENYQPANDAEYVF